MDWSSVQWVLLSVFIIVCAFWGRVFFSWVGRSRRERLAERLEHFDAEYDARARYEHESDTARRAVPLPSMCVPDGFRTGHGRRMHAVKLWAGGSHVKVISGVMTCKSYCGIEIVQDRVEEVSVDCQSCLKALASESAEARRQRLAKREPVQRPTAWERIEEDDL